MTRYFCHECSHEGSDFATSQEGFICPNCGGSFCEEIPNNDGMADDPREFDPVEDDEEDDFGFFGSPNPNRPTFANSGRGNTESGHARGTGNGNFFHYESPGGGFVFTGGFGAGAAGLGGPAAGQANPLAHSLLQAFGLAPPAQGPYAAATPATGNEGGPSGRPQARRWQSAGANDPANRQQQDQVPIQNLATFLNDAFGGPHPADDPSNNPFAEGSHETGAEAEQAPQQDVRQGGAAQHPLGTLFSLFGNVFGAAPMHGNAGDYVWGSEANFQQLLNDLMEQAAGRAGPQPAPDDMIEKLPRLKVDQSILDMDSVTTCGVCLETFQLGDGAVALPCKHFYHEDCLVPWLKTSGTCPICRYALVPQPGQPGYGEEDQQQPQRSPGSTGPTATGSSASTSGSGPSGPSTSFGTGSGPRPPLSTRPWTSQIPDVEGGSTLPGSWIWPASDSDNQSPSSPDRRTSTVQNSLAEDRGDSDLLEDRDPDDAPLPSDPVPTTTGSTSSTSGNGADQARSAARAAAEAAERRLAAEAEERRRQQAASAQSPGPARPSAQDTSTEPQTPDEGPPIDDVD